MPFHATLARSEEIVNAHRRRRLAPLGYRSVACAGGLPPHAGPFAFPSSKWRTLSRAAPPRSKTQLQRHLHQTRVVLLGRIDLPEIRTGRIRIRGPKTYVI